MTPKPTRWLLACCCLALMTAPVALLAQDSDAAAPDPEAEDPSRETDISEDNYRRFMELDDRRLERPAFPVSAVQPTTGLQKMGQLPESSQKHLRNQLRGIILSRGAWTPAERDETYAFVPSPEARGDAQLLRQEAEAWTELVNEYHDREAAILAAAGQPAGEGDRTPQDPRSVGQAPAGQPPGSQAQQQANVGTGTGGNPGADGQQGEDGESGQEGREGARGESGSEGGPDSESGSESSTASPPQERPEVPEWVAENDAGRTPAAPGNKGVEQSASEYLEARGLADPAPAQLDDTRSRTAPASVERASRWGEEAQTLLDDRNAQEVRSRRASTPPTAGDRSEDGAPVNTLTREQLRGVRGVTEDDAPPEDVFVDFYPEDSAMPVSGVNGEETANAGDEGREVPDKEDDGRP
jgi:hypothetical protein